MYLFFFYIMFRPYWEFRKEGNYPDIREKKKKSASREQMFAINCNLLGKICKQQLQLQQKVKHMSSVK